MDFEFYRQYCDLKVRVAPFRKKADFETIKTVAAIDALADRAEVLSHGSNESRFGWNDDLGFTQDGFFKRATELLEELEKAVFRLPDILPSRAVL